MIPDGSVMLYDGSCGFCARTVQFVLDRERERRTLCFAPLDGAFAGARREAHPELRGVDSIVLVTRELDGRERVAVRSEAALAIAAYLGGPWRPLARVSAWVPRVLRDRVYDVVARHRHRILRDRSVCLIPTEQQRSRFLA
jgi:predicted DCC family thiol-disulfide oxidoreductase YuxK